MYEDIIIDVINIDENDRISDILETDIIIDIIGKLQNVIERCLANGYITLQEYYTIMNYDKKYVNNIENYGWVELYKKDIKVVKIRGKKQLVIKMPPVIFLQRKRDDI